MEHLHNNVQSNSFQQDQIGNPYIDDNQSDSKLSWKISASIAPSSIESPK